jgi:AcrR family transcriptional regulator
VPHRRTTALPQRVRDRARALAAETYQDEILRAAERVFAERGFMATKISDIARAAGLATGTLYNYFDSKDEILRSLMVRRGEEFLAGMVAVVGSSAADPTARLTALVTATLEYLERHRSTFQIFEELGASSDWEVQRICGEDMSRLHDGYHDLLAGIVRDGVAKGLLRKLPIDDHVAFLTGTLHGFMRAWMAAPSKPGQRAAMIVDLFLNGAAR